MADSVDYNTFIDNIALSLGSQIESLRDLKYAFALAVIGFVLFSPCYRSRKSMWDAIAANRMISFLRGLIFLEVMACLLLLYFAISWGSPLALHQYTSYGNGDSWMYGYGRPLFGLFAVGVGTLGDMHPLPRLICACSVVAQMTFDALSAFQIQQYLVQMRTLAAPTGDYPEVAMVIYYYRDVASFGLNMWICLLNMLFIVTVGVCNPPFLTYQTIAGGDFDRCKVMRQQRLVENAYRLKKENAFHSKTDARRSSKELSNGSGVAGGHVDEEANSKASGAFDV